MRWWERISIWLMKDHRLTVSCLTPASSLSLSPSQRKVPKLLAMLWSAREIRSFSVNWKLQGN